MAAYEHEFRAKTSEGDIFGWVHESVGAKRHAVLLHGGPGITEYLAPLARELDGLLNTARYQQRGLAPSTTTGAATIARHVEDVFCVIGALGWQRPIVVGHSWGGSLAMHAAAAQPDKFGALVIVDALGPTRDGGNKQFQRNMIRGLTHEELARLGALEKIEKPTHGEIREYQEIVWPRYFADPSRAGRLPDEEYAESADQTWESIRAEVRKGTLARRLPRVTVPTLVIHGDKSPIPTAQARRIVEVMPDATLVVVPDSGHFAWLEQPGFVRAAVTEFLGRL